MNRRSAFALLVGIALVMPMSAWAQGNGNGHDNPSNGGGNGNGHDNASNGGGNGNGHASGGAGNGNGNANGQDKRDDRGGKGNANGQDGNTVAPDRQATATDNLELSESEALAAVQAGSAVSLETLLPDVRTRTGGEIINAKLQVASGFLLYGVTALTPGGKVVTEYYYARSGIHVGN